MKQKILELKALGKTNKEIAKELKISYSLVLYYTSEDYKNKSMARTKQWLIKNREKYNKSRREYNKAYMKNRYKTDPEFRKNKIKKVLESRNGMSNN